MGVCVRVLTFNLNKFALQQLRNVCVNAMGRCTSRGREEEGKVKVKLPRHVANCGPCCPALPVKKVVANSIEYASKCSASLALNRAARFG